MDEAEVTRAVLHSLVALVPADRYRVGGVKLNITRLVDQMMSDDVGGDRDDHFDDMTCSACSNTDTATDADDDDDDSCSDQKTASANENEEVEVVPVTMVVMCYHIITGVLYAGYHVLRKEVLYRVWKWWEVPLVTIPLAYLDALFMYMLPPRMAEAVWQAVILPCVVGVV